MENDLTCGFYFVPVHKYDSIYGFSTAMYSQGYTGTKYGCQVTGDK